MCVRARVIKCTRVGVYVLGCVCICGGCVRGSV